jgi:SAM-dependent methyltransferase
MSGFTTDWLELREAADGNARSAYLCTQLAAALTPGRERRVVDLGSGIGANLRYLAPRLGGDQHWLLVDHDQALLDYAPHATKAWADAKGLTVSADGGEFSASGDRFSLGLRWRKADITLSLDRLITPDVDLVTASALLDLVSTDWIERLVQQCRAACCALMLALSYDGRMTWQPALDADEAIRGLFNRHQRTDKGFGRAVGPDGVVEAARQLRGAAFEVLSDRSDWRLTGADARLQRALLIGCAQAATAMNQDFAGRIDEWLGQRLALIAHPEGEVTVGHVDLLGLP